MAEPPICGRCGTEALLSARVPHGWLNDNGQAVQGTGVVVLCQRCDIAHPEGGALIAWFTVHSEITNENLQEAANLIEAWASSARIPAPNGEALDEEIDAWYRGDL